MNTGTTDTYQTAFKYVATVKLEPIDENTGVNLETSLGEVPFFSKPTYIVCITVGLTEYVMHSMTCPVNMGAGLSLVNDAYVRLQWRK